MVVKSDDYHHQPHDMMAVKWVGGPCVGLLAWRGIEYKYNSAHCVIFCEKMCGLSFSSARSKETLESCYFYSSHHTTPHHFYVFFLLFIAEMRMESKQRSVVKEIMMGRWQPHFPFVPFLVFLAWLGIMGNLNWDWELSWLGWSGRGGDGMSRHMATVRKRDKMWKWENDGMVW